MPVESTWLHELREKENEKTLSGMIEERTKKKEQNSRRKKMVIDIAF